MSQSLLELGVILAVLFAGGLIASRLRQSVIPAYILGGILLHNFVTNVELIHLLSTIGLMLLLFFIGLEFSTSYLRHHVRPISRAGAIDLAVNFPLGLFIGRAMGWDWLASAYLGAIVYISSSAVVTKAMIDNRQAANPEADTIIGILVFEDLAIVLILALLTGFQSGSVEAASLSWTLLKIALFITPFLLLPPSVIPRLNRLLHVESTELFLLMALAVVLLASALSTHLGFSEAVGAFLVGLLFSETAHRQRIIDRLAPFRDLFAAIFFLSFGLMIPWEGWSGTSLPIAGLVLLGVAGKMATGYLVGQSSRLSGRSCASTGIALIPRGEFSIILAVAAAGGLPDGPIKETILPISAGFVLATGGIGVIGMREFPAYWIRRKKKG